MSVAQQNFANCNWQIVGMYLQFAINVNVYNYLRSES